MKTTIKILLVACVLAVITAFTMPCQADQQPVKEKAKVEAVAPATEQAPAVGTVTSVDTSQLQQLENPVNEAAPIDEAKAADNTSTDIFQFWSDLSTWQQIAFLIWALISLIYYFVPTTQEYKWLTWIFDWLALIIPNAKYLGGTHRKTVWKRIR